jgi:general stress protein 26
MKHMTKKVCFVFIFILDLLIAPTSAGSQNAQEQIPRDTLIAAALDIIKSTNYCALVTLDESGQPQVRTMNPFPMTDKIDIWFATNRNSRKVNEIKKDPRISVYWADHTNASGYVTVNGKATIIDDKDLLIKKKRAYWDGIPNWQDVFVLIKITPATMDVINYKKKIGGDPVTNRAPVVKF